ncbi:hypothetical protein PHAMO_330007 [Magnetospirillum molischianum DSM 120]|uniref:Uncharacterized protein n=1 Tax=Magnetospirillum molischianum DSM 120 TaxID=1150626 RepID=H8FUT0_MAGML|nr:hypothetical protein PHAMO_330007 [Magnetospirillum molischianum DSM 120]
MRVSHYVESSEIHTHKSYLGEDNIHAFYFNDLDSNLPPALRNIPKISVSWNLAKL